MSTSNVPPQMGSPAPQWPTQPGWPPPPTPPRSRSLLGFGVAAGAVALAAGAFFVGHGVANAKPASASFTPTAANVAAASGPAPAGTAACTAPEHDRGVAGTLKAVNGSKLTVTNRNNQDVTVNTSDTTKVTIVSDGAVSDVTNGAVVRVHGTSGANTSVTADQIAVVPAGTQPAAKAGGRSGAAMQQRGIATGTVSDATGGKFTVTTADGTKVTVNTSGSTKVVKSTTAKVSDLKVGKPVAVEGTTNADGSVTANAIQQNTSTLTPGSFGGGRFGGDHGGHGRPGGQPDDDSKAPGSPTPGAPAGGTA